ncbi:MAG: ribonuclease R, partial [Rhizobiales bacterium]|nr:ribonuclease R [Hyphomicrobiales bacterium]
KRPEDLPSVAVLAITGRDDDGELLAEPVEWDEAAGAPPKITVTLEKKQAGPAPGVGDRILARLRTDDEGALSARVIRVIERKPEGVIGVIRMAPDGARMEPVDRKQKALRIEAADMGSARDGDLVGVVVTRLGRFGFDRAKVVEVIGSMKSEKAVSLIAIHAHDIPHVFPPDVLAEAKAAKPVPMREREDWRDVPLLTIDPVDAKDHDDAVFAEPDSEHEGGFIVTVAIADVAWYVRPASPLDREALKRGNSVYFPDRVVPMLPERISNDLCSLREEEDRPSLAVRMTFSAEGRKTGHRFHRIMMRSAAKLSYQEAQRAFDGADIGRGARIAGALATLWQAYAVLKRGRDAREPLELDLPERKIVLNKDGGIDRVIVPERLEAHRLIEEFMIQANVAAAETLEARKSPLVYRIHDTPSLAKLEGLREFLASIDVSLPKGGNLRPSHFNRILARLEESEHSQLVHEVVLRTQAQAEYNPENIGHFGLNLRRYAHFTSPIRRYADLIVHRALIRALNLGEGGLPDHYESQLPAIAAEISATERRAMAAERDTVDRLVAHWLADRVGSTFRGRISGVTRAGLFVKLDETGADGFVPMSTIGNDYYVYDESRHAVIGRRTGEMHRLGDQVEVKLVEATPLAGGLRFELLSEGRILKRSERPKDEPRRRGRDGARPAGRRR